MSFVPHGETVNAQYYAAYLQNHLRRAVRRKRPQLQNVVILHDNAPPHTAMCVMDLVRRWRWEILEHPPYIPDLSATVRRLLMTENYFMYFL